MTSVRRAAAFAACAALLAGPAMAQAINATRSSLPDLPYTLLYPDVMIASENGPDGRVRLNHVNAPVRCDLVVIPVEDAEWTPQSALDAFDRPLVQSQWNGMFPGFTITDAAVAPIHGGEALVYRGSSPESDLSLGLDFVHLETVDENRGYVLDCFYPTAIAPSAKPMVDFVVGNFSTRSDAECCSETARPEALFLRP